MFEYLFGAATFIPHGYYMTWRPDLVAMHGLADALTALAYFSIPVAIFLFLHQRKDFEHRGAAWLFAAFIFFSGLTHLTGLATLWVPAYGFEGMLKLVTAGVSVATAALIWPYLPKAIALPRPSELRAANAQLSDEISRRLEVEAELKRANELLQASKVELEAQLLNEQALESSRAQDLQDTIETIPDAVALFDKNNKLRLWNSAYTDMYARTSDIVRAGIDYDELSRMGALRGKFNLKGKSIEGWVNWTVGAFSAAGEPFDLEFADGRIIEAINRRSASGRTVCIRRDVTAERHGVSELASLTERLQLVLNTTHNGIMALDRDGRVAMVNSAARHMLGGIAAATPFAWPDEIVFLGKESLKPLAPGANPIRRAMDGQTLQSETHIMTRCSSQQQRYVRINSTAVADRSSQMRTVVAIDDVTSIERTRQRSERASRLEALGQLTGGIAHDFNNILAVILSAIEVTRLKAHEPDQPDHLDIATRAVKRGAELTQRLLAFAKRQPGRARTLLVADVIANVHAIARPTIEESIDMVVECDDRDLAVYCDPSQLENALLNLLINARDAIVSSKNGDLITIRGAAVDLAGAMDEGGQSLSEQDLVFRAKGMDELRQEDRQRDDGRGFRYIDISVTDNGPGMSQEVKRRAIDPFFSTKAEGMGSGLGLSMVYGFVQQSDGELRIYSEEGLGTVIRMVLPRAIQDQEHREAPASCPPLEQGDGATVLAVEDEDALRDMLAGTLEMLGYRVLTAANAIEALELVERGVEVDLVLTDIVMPLGVNGFELAQKLRAIKPEMPIIYMSGYSGFDKSQMGSVIAPMLEKPCSSLKLSRVIKAELEAVRRLRNGNPSKA